MWSRYCCLGGMLTLLPLLSLGENVQAADGVHSPAGSCLPFIERHFQQLTSSGLDNYGPRRTKMWMAIIDTRTGAHPTFEHTPKRVYRRIGAPRGSSLYWDQPMIAAAHRLSEVTGDPRYRRAADAYLRDFLACCVDADGMFRWGNHCYYHAFEDRIATFSGGYHELRPHVPVWELIWRQDAEACERYLRTMVVRHVYDFTTGGFNRHDNGKREHAFLEAGGVLVESLAWLYAKTGDQDLLDLARKIAHYSYNHRGNATGLIVNDPDGGRWDSKVCTTEVAAWAICLLHSAEYTSNNEFSGMAREAVAAYLKYGYDDSTGKYFGQLNVKTGEPVVPEDSGYWPRKYSEIWNPDQWPTHDYPLAMAEACVALHQRTGDDLFAHGTRRWAELIRRGSAAERRTAYAGQYGRCIRFLVRASAEIDSPQLKVEAHRLADEAIDRLCENGWFQGYPESHLYESVDGVGDLFLALIELETSE